MSSTSSSNIWSLIQSDCCPWCATLHTDNKVIETLNVSPSSTCRQLHQFICLKDTWIVHLRRVARERGAYWPSYPIDEMTVVELRNAALAPRRWMGKLLEAGNQPTTAIDLLEPIQHNKFLPGNWWEDMQASLSAYLVPGGRFLVTVGKSLLTMWDLGPSRSATAVVTQALLSVTAGRAGRRREI